MERRKFPRFNVMIQVEAGREGKESSIGLIEDFSRGGFRAVFDKFEFEFNLPLQLRIQRPNSDFYASASAEPIWKRSVEDKWDVGFKLKTFPPEAKAEILECGYFKWLKESVHPY